MKKQYESPEFDLLNLKFEPLLNPSDIHTPKEDGDDNNDE